MSYVSWKELWPLVMPQVPLCPPPIITKALRNATRELCEKAHVWKDHCAIPVGGGKGDYELPAAANYRVARLDAAVLEGRDLDIVPADDARESYAAWHSGGIVGTPEIVTQTTPDSIWLIPFPSADMELMLAMSLAPKLESSEVESRLIEQYEETIVAGAIARLKAMTNVAWSAPAEAAGYANLFTAGIIDANVNASKAFGRAPVRVRAHYM